MGGWFRSVGEHGGMEAPAEDAWVYGQWREEPQRCFPRQSQFRRNCRSANSRQRMDDGEMTDTGKEQDRLAPMVAMRDEKTRGERGFKRVLGVTPAAFAREQRRERFRSGVRRPRMTVTEAVYEAGFGSPSRLYEGVGASLGMSPSAMKAGGAGETIHYSITESPLGRLLVAATARGLCAVLFAEGAEGGAGGMGSPDAELIFELRQRFPQAALRAATAGGEALPGEAVQWVLSHLSEHPSASALPFHIRATAFQQRVWQALMRIPRGETRTYVEIAATIGSPRSVRAVGAACGANPLAVVIPCHRVVGAKGRLTGYRWGVERKKRLLELEAEAGKLAVAVGAPVLPSR